VNYRKKFIRGYGLKTLLVFGFASISLLLFTTCGKEYLFATKDDCNNCISPRPYYGPINIRLSQRATTDTILVKVFKGKFTEKMLRDNENIIYSAKTTDGSLDVDVPLDEYYSVVAEYKVDGKTYYVVDGDKIKSYSIESTCETDCWIIRGGKINCRLKF
jgi:hypothetical protein